MANIKDVEKGVIVRINPENSRKIKSITEKTKRSFSAEVNKGVEEYANKKIEQNGE